MSPPRDRMTAVPQVTIAAWPADPGIVAAPAPARVPPERSARPAGRDDLAERGLALLLQEAHAALGRDRRRERLAPRLRARAFVDFLHRVDVRVETRRWRRRLLAQRRPQAGLVDEALQRRREVAVVAGARAQPGTAPTLGQGPEIARDARQAELEALVEHEAERLDARA